MRVDDVAGKICQAVPTRWTNHRESPTAPRNRRQLAPMPGDAGGFVPPCVARATASVQRRQFLARAASRGVGAGAGVGGGGGAGAAPPSGEDAVEGGAVLGAPPPVMPTMAATPPVKPPLAGPPPVSPHVTPPLVVPPPVTPLLDAGEGGAGLGAHGALDERAGAALHLPPVTPPLAAPPTVTPPLATPPPVTPPLAALPPVTPPLVAPPQVTEAGGAARHLPPVTPPLAAPPLVTRPLAASPPVTPPLAAPPPVTPPLAAPLPPGKPPLAAQPPGTPPMAAPPPLTPPLNASEGGAGLAAHGAPGAGATHPGLAPAWPSRGRSRDCVWRPELAEGSLVLCRPGSEPRLFRPPGRA